MENPESLENTGVDGLVDSVDSVDKKMEKITNPFLYESLDCMFKFFENVDLFQKYPHLFRWIFTSKNVDNVDKNYFNKFSPILKTSPAPIVINKSPLIQFFNKNFSISSKDEK